MSRFTEKETEQLQAVSDLLMLTREHLARSEKLRLEELPLNAYEVETIAAYRSQLRAVLRAYERLLDLRLEQSPDADQAGRMVEDAHELLDAMLNEMRNIVSSYFDAYQSTGAIE